MQGLLSRLSMILCRVFGLQIKRDNNRISLAKEHLRGIKRQLRSLNERVVSLEEELKILNEDK